MGIKEVEYQKRPESPFHFFNPDTLVTGEMREWLSRATIAHIAPLWLPLPRSEIAYEGKTYPARKYGGAEDVVMNLISSLHKFGAKEQIIFGHPGNRVLTQTIGARVFTPKHVDMAGDLLGMLQEDPEKARYIEGMYVYEAYKMLSDMGKVTIIHDHTNVGRDFGMWSSVFFTPVIRTEHGPLVRPNASATEERHLKTFEDRKGMGFVGISDHQIGQNKNLHWLGKSGNGVDLNTLTYREEKSDFFFFIGRICREKGVHNAIRLALELNTKLIIAGKVEKNPESQQYFEEEIKPYIDGVLIRHLEEGVDAEERDRYLGNAIAVLVLNEWAEPFGNVMVEAMACGTPVLGTRKGSIPEIVIEGTGFVIDTMDQAASFGQRLRNGEYSTRTCREWVEKQFSKEAMTARYIPFYMEMQRRDQMY